jgi:hypothetical protein
MLAMKPLYRLLKPLKKLIDKVTGKRDENDDHFNHPYIIL